MSTALSHVVMSWPTPVGALLAEMPTVPAGPSKSWIQIAKTGSFVSQRYGKFSITTQDLTQMLTNFQTITPKAPTKLPIDYDHLSMDPQRPGDGAAAGWISDLQLRDNGNELWGHVEWTPDAASAIRNRQYQFVSPSFVKDYVYKDGNVIGTTLLAAAITNHPFLEGMAALTLSGGLKELGTLIMAADVAAAGGVSVEVGQKVSVKDEEVQKPEQLGVVFTVSQVVGEGENAFVSLQAPDGTIAEWFRVDELQPAVADAMAPPPMPGSIPESASKPAGLATEMPPESLKAPQLAAPLPGVQGAAPNSSVTTVGNAGPASPGSAAKIPTVPMHPYPSTAQVGMNARRESHMKTFELTDIKGEKVTVSEEVLQAAAGNENESLQAEVKTLSNQVEIMANAAASAERRTRQGELTKELDRLSQGGFITKPTREWAAKKFGGDQVDLAGFKEWAALQTTSIVKLHTEHGSGSGLTPDKDSPAEDLISLAHKLEREKRIPYRDALIQASKLNADASERYREQFAE